MENTNRERNDGALDAFNESEIAQSKLQRLLSPDFTRYALRFMNEGEYKEMIRQGKPIAGLETNAAWLGEFFVDQKKPLSFEKFLSMMQDGSQGFSNAYAIDAWTNWSRGTDDIGRAKDALRDLRRSHKEAARAGTENIRSRTLQLLKQKMKNDPFGEAPLSAKKTEALDEGRTHDARTALRSLLNGSSRRVLDRQEEDEGYYHIMLVLDGEAVKGAHTWGRERWKTISDDAGPESVLAAVSLLPTKELYREMIDASKHSGTLAHPIFDNHGIVRWPNDISG